MPNIDEMPKVGNIINESSSFLSSEGIQESIGKTKWLLSSLFNLSTTEIDLDHDRNLTAKELEKFNGWLSRCAEGEPVQYITNETDFFSLTFHLNKDVLIPRAETERLVEIAIEHVNNSHIQSVLDIGTGCGCIAISLAKNCEHLSIMAIDKSKDALKLANRNSCLNSVNNRIDFFQLNILTQNPVKKFDLVVSNPPYISINEYRCLDKTIKLELVDGPFSHLNGEWGFKKKDNFNTQVSLYLEYQFDNRIIEMSLKPIFSSIMNSILDSFISEAFRIKNDKQT